MSRIPIAALLLLAACGSPMERCERSIVREEQRLDALIAETETNLRRGYGYETETRDVSVGFSYCNRSRNVGVCFDNRTPRTIRRAVAIDPEAEQRKLAGLKDRKLALQSRSCRADGAMILPGPPPPPTPPRR